MVEVGENFSAARGCQIHLGLGREAEWRRCGCVPRGTVGAEGFTEIKVIEFRNDYSPVLHYATLCVVLSVSVKLWLKRHSLDVKNAFLNAKFKEAIYVSQPNGFLRKNKEHWVYTLRKALCRLLQSLGECYWTLHKFFDAVCFVQSKADLISYVWTRHISSVMIKVYEDDVLGSSNYDDLLALVINCFEGAGGIGD